MLNNFKTFVVAILVIFASVDRIDAQYVSGVSWVFRGTVQQNNTVLTFNMYDTLNLICKSTGSDEPRYSFTFAFTKGSSPPTSMSTYTSGNYKLLTVTDPETMVWNDFDGIQPGFENFIIYGDGLSYSSSYNYEAQYAFRYLNIGTLMTTDSGTYHCSVMYSDGSLPSYLGTSGGLTLQINTKESRSSRAKVNHLLTYSAVIVGASKIFI